LWLEIHDNAEVLVEFLMRRACCSIAALPILCAIRQGGKHGAPFKARHALAENWIVK